MIRIYSSGTLTDGNVSAQWSALGMWTSSHWMIRIYSSASTSETAWNTNETKARTTKPSTSGGSDERKDYNFPCIPAYP